MIKHFGRWVIALTVATVGASWLLRHELGQATFTRVLWVLYVAAPVVGLLAVERRRGARPGALAVVATTVAATALAWILLGLEARWWIRWLLLIVLAAPLMSVANASIRADIRRAQR